MEKAIGKAIKGCFRTVGAVLVMLLPALAALADAPETGVITFNVANSGGNGADNTAQVSSGFGDVETLAGTLNYTAWINSNGGGSETVSGSTDGYRNGSYAAGSPELVAWDGSAVTALSGLSVAWRVNGTSVNNYCRNTGASPNWQKCWLARGDGSTHDSEPAIIEFTGIPYRAYDVIVYLSGGASLADGSAFRPVKVGDTYYVGDTSSSDTYKTVSTPHTSSVQWGTRQDSLAYGVNALRITGRTGSSLVIRMEQPGCGTNSSGTQATSQGISAVQIVERTDIHIATLDVSSSADWSGSDWTVDGVQNSAFSPEAGRLYSVTVTVDGDCTLAMPQALGESGGCGIDFRLADGVSSAAVTLLYSGTLPSDPAETLSMNPFGAASVSAEEGVTLTPAYDGDTAGYATAADGLTLLVAKRPEIGVVSVRIGARAKDASSGYIDPSYSAVGPYPISGLFWEQTKFWNNNSTTGNYTDIQNLTDAESGDSTIRIGYYGHNTYYNSGTANDASTPNQVLTKTYLDDSDSGSGNLTATASEGGETITLPSPGFDRGWQLHFENIPYNAYDVYFITASDVVDGSLKECPIYVSLDGGTNWKSYVGDSENGKTVMGTTPWSGLPCAAQGGVLVEGRNYIKMRITKSLYGDDIGTIDITHGTRNTGNKIRSGLAAIQIVEVRNDGVYTLGGSGRWSDAIWSVGDEWGQTWTDTVDGAPSIAKIESSLDIQSVEVDQDVSAGSVILTGEDDFTVEGSGTLTVETGFDASDFTGALNLQAPIDGTIYIGSGTSLQFGGDTDMTLPSYTLDGAGEWTKVGTGKLTVNSSVALSGRVEGGTLEIVSDYAGGISLAGGDLSFAGGDDEIVYSGQTSLAAGGTGKTVVSSGVVNVTGKLATDVDIEQGATLKMGVYTALDAGEASVSSHTTTVRGTLELNGMEGCNAYVLDGGKIQNTGDEIGTSSRQTCGLTLTADSEVGGTSSFGIINNGYGAVSVDLGGHTLAKTGDCTFWLCNVTTDSAEGSAIDVQGGSLTAHARNTSSINVPVNLARDTSIVMNGAATFRSISGAGSVTGTGMLTTTGLDLSEGLTVDSPVTLADGATVVLGSGDISGAVTVPSGATVAFDASAIAATVQSGDHLISGEFAAVGSYEVGGLPAGMLAEVVNGRLVAAVPVATLHETSGGAESTTSYGSLDNAVGAMLASTADSAFVTMDDGSAPSLTVAYLVAGVARDAANARLVKASTWYWTGAAEDGRFFTPGNWENASGVTAAALLDGDSFTFRDNGELAVNYDDPGDFVVSSITFGSGLAGTVTVEGESVAEIIAIVNESAYAAEFRNEVFFEPTSSINVTVSGQPVKFTGGVTGSGIRNHTEFYGRYTLTTEGDVTPGQWVLKSGSEFSIPNGTYYCHIGNLTIEEGAVFRTLNARMDRETRCDLTARNDGEFRVTGTFTTGGSSDVLAYLLLSDGEDSTGVFIFNKVVFSGDLKMCANSYVAPLSVVIGEGGMIRSADSNGYNRIGNGRHMVYGTLGDSFISFGETPILDDGRKVIYHTDNSDAGVDFVTTDYDDPTVGRTITAYGQIGAKYPARFSMNVSGLGSFVFANRLAGDAQIFSGGLTVSDSATVVVNALSCPGRGAVTLGGTSTLRIPQDYAGTATVNGALTFGDGTTLEIDNLVSGAETVPLTLGSGIAMPEQGSVNLVASGADGAALAEGNYVLAAAATAPTAEDLAKFGLSGVLVEDGLAAALSVDGQNIVLAVSSATMSDWPAEWNGGAPANDTQSAAFAAWKAAGNDPSAGDAEAAFLLGLDVAEYSPLAVTAVSVADGEITISTSVDLDGVNGVPYILWGETPEDITNPLAADIGEDDAFSLVGIEATAEKRFFKVCVGYAVPESAGQEP